MARLAVAVTMFEALIILAGVAGWIFWVVERILREGYQKRWAKAEEQIDELRREKALSGLSQRQWEKTLRGWR